MLAGTEVAMPTRADALTKGKPRELIGRWRLTGMSNWDNEFMDAESPAVIEFEPGGCGEFHFG